MPHRTAPSVARAELDQAPPDIATMRTTTHRLLAEHAKPIDPEQLETLRLALYGHLQLLIPIIEAMTLGLPKDNVPRACALACAGEARMRVRLRGGDNPPGRMSVAMRLARSVNALCDHYDRLASSLADEDVS
ncbi:DUF6415 family natural product biosynthesis protein [Streptomyces sp. NBC_01618]|uniref:DUF6415 family natural product biosynthesis protein n=1 Tax=Streptomyces sp. NBC_01618 TaxID=2975900 RepID=UPI0038662CBF|nr:DUF6415 family natural product biosynthesis protein [Streptomyces sp. NBC_01618]